MIHDELSELLNSKIPLIEEAILNREFKVVERTQLTVELIILGERISIWIDSLCCPYRVDFTDRRNSYVYFDITYSFKKEKKCRLILEEQSEEELAIEKEILEDTILKLQTKLNNIAR